MFGRCMFCANDKHGSGFRVQDYILQPSLSPNADIFNDILRLCAAVFKTTNPDIFYEMFGIICRHLCVN